MWCIVHCKCRHLGRKNKRKNDEKMKSEYQKALLERRRRAVKEELLRMKANGTTVSSIETRLGARYKVSAWCIHRDIMALRKEMREAAEREAGRTEP